jgi:hypothetical protein
VNIMPKMVYDYLDEDSLVPVVGGHKIHIFIANIPTFHARYRT